MSDPPDTASLTPRVLEWRGGGELVDFGGNQIFARRRDGAGPLLLFLHGFSSSSYDWRGTLGVLAERATLALDQLGFGLSDKPRDASYSLFMQADIVERLVADRRGPGVVVAHDMGTSVATELPARDLEGSLGFGVAGVLLFNGSMIIEWAKLTWAQKALRSPAGAALARQHPAAVREPVLAAVLRRSPSRRGRGRRPMGAVERSRRRPAGPPSDRLRLGAQDARGALARDDSRLAGDLRLAWGMRDWVATPKVLAGLRELRPGAPVTELLELGHYPQIEQLRTIAALAEQLASSVM